MKRYLIPTILFLVFGILLFTFAVYSQYTVVQYEKDVYFHITEVFNEGYVYGEYDGVKTEIVGSNLSKIQSALTITKRKRLYKKPNLNNSKPLLLTFSTGATFDIYIIEDSTDGVYIHYKYKNKSQWYSINGYNSFYWLSSAVSPNGIKNENIILE